MTSNLHQKFITNINGILGVNKPTKIAVAVSGGADSVALLDLVARWSEVEKLDVTIFSVDHNLRPESKDEIAYVKSLADKNGFHFIPLSWSAEGKTSGIQARARNGRYNLMQEHCKKLNISLLLTAHHLDDMLETYLIKQSKKASLLALAPNITKFIQNLWIVRPLFNITKQELLDYLVQNNIHWFEDESNKSDKYERNRVRKVLEKLSIKEKEDLIDEYSLVINKSKDVGASLISAFAEAVSIYNYGFAKIDLSKFNEFDEEIRIYLLNYVLTVISGKTIVPRYRNLSRVISTIADNTFKVCTLSYCTLVSKNNNLIIYKEKALIAQEEAEFENQMIWDNRFKFNNDQLLIQNKNFKVSSLKMSDYIRLKKLVNLKKLAEISDNSHKAILFTLPVIKDLEKVVAIPHISYYDSDLNNMKVIFSPNFISRFTHFF